MILVLQFRRYSANKRRAFFRLQAGQALFILILIRQVNRQALQATVQGSAIDPQ